VTKSIDAWCASGTAMNGPNGNGFGRPIISLKKVADSFASCECTIV